MSYGIQKFELALSWRISVLALVIVTLMDWAGYVGALRRTISYGLQPVVWSVAWGQEWRQGWWRRLEQLGNISRQNLELQRQVAELQVQANRASELEAENQQLRRAIGLPTRLEHVQALGKIVAIETDKFVIWSERPVASGTPVIVEGRLTGVVVSAGGPIVVADRVGFGQGKIWVKLGGGQGQIVAIGNTLWLRNVSKEVNLGPGERIATIGDTQIPPDWWVGNVLEYQTSQEDAYAQVKIEGVSLQVGAVVYLLEGV